MKKGIFCYVFSVMMGIAGISGAASETSGTAKVQISASIKTHSKWYHILDKAGRGTPGYTMEVVVDGKTYQLTGAPEKDVVKRGDRKNPEEGTGARFNFSGNVSVPAGSHKVTFRIPVDNVSVQSDLTFSAGDNTVTVKPIYAKIARNRIIGFRGDRHFSQHVETLTVTTK